MTARLANLKAMDSVNTNLWRLLRKQFDFSKE